MVADDARAAASYMAGLELLGIRATNTAVIGDQAGIEAKINDRLEFIKNKNWGEADRIRDELNAQGIQLKDSKDPETGERSTTWEVM